MMNQKTKTENGKRSATKPVANRVHAEPQVTPTQMHSALVSALCDAARTNNPVLIQMAQQQYEQFWTSHEIVTREAK